MNNLIDTNLSSRRAACSLPGSMLCMFCGSWSKNWFCIFIKAFVNVSRTDGTFIPPRQVFCLPFTFITTCLCKDDDGRGTALTVGCTSATQDAMCTTLVLTSRVGV